MAQRAASAAPTGTLAFAVFGLALLHGLLLHRDVGPAYLAMNLLPVYVLVGPAIAAGWLLALFRPRSGRAPALAVLLGAATLTALVLFPWMVYFNAFTLAGNEALARRADVTAVPAWNIILVSAGLYLIVLIAVTLLALLRRGKTARSA